MPKYHVLYKCRHCGMEVDYGQVIETDDAINMMKRAMNRLEGVQTIHKGYLIPTTVPFGLHGVHGCRIAEFGITDFAGLRMAREGE